MRAGPSAVGVGCSEGAAWKGRLWKGDHVDGAVGGGVEGRSVEGGYECKGRSSSWWTDLAGDVVEEVAAAPLALDDGLAREAAEAGDVVPQPRGEREQLPN